MAKYSERFRTQMVKRMVGPNGMTATQLSAQVGVSQSTLSKWLRDSVADVADHENDDEPTPTKTRSALQRMELVVQAAKLDDSELGAFLRRHGVHESELRQWREQLEGALAAAPRPSRSSAKDKKRIKSLERELRKKEKALAEAAALLVLQKKVRAIWGDEDDDTDEVNRATKEIETAWPKF